MAKQKSALNGVAALYENRRQAHLGMAPTDEEFEKRWPLLFSLLSNNRVDSERFTDPVRLSVFNSCGDWCIGLSCSGLGQYGEMLHKTFLGGLDATERALADQTFPWKINMKKDVKIKELKKFRN